MELLFLQMIFLCLLINTGYIDKKTGKTVMIVVYIAGMILYGLFSWAEI